MADILKEAKAKSKAMIAEAKRLKEEAREKRDRMVIAKYRGYRERNPNATSNKICIAVGEEMSISSQSVKNILMAHGLYETCWNRTKTPLK